MSDTSVTVIYHAISLNVLLYPLKTEMVLFNYKKFIYDMDVVKKLNTFLSYFHE